MKYIYYAIGGNRPTDDVFIWKKQQKKKKKKKLTW